ncbi:hypothetical protein [Thioflexithrix psekupsensis]|uniref:Uncharacterized protein n=1 Tax=Thioflexithrix psekupsensis TaxID=1570016 RepID=A0A251X3G7_9GAMM|nr:hypothetical protein [Thioflexithrix psekupsensis]OUD12034.1 hypothetical protein TPSD3_12925 [Thioflexithrix psekupsensis]
MNNQTTEEYSAYALDKADKLLKEIIQSGNFAINKTTANRISGEDQAAYFNALHKGLLEYYSNLGSKVK